jgi:hypothetical protein
MKNTDLELHEKYGLKEIESPVMHMEETLRSPTAKVFTSMESTQISVMVNENINQHLLCKPCLFSISYIRQFRISLHYS